MCLIFLNECYMDRVGPILAIDTSTSYLSLALQNEHKRYAAHLQTGQNQTQWILPQIKQLLQQADIQVADLSAIIYAQGPGMFTGLRIGLGVAQGLAVPFDIDLIGIPCLDAVAYQMPNHKSVLAATDARMNEVFYAWFDTENHQRLSDYSVGCAMHIRQPESVNIQDVRGIGNAFALNSLPVFSGCPDMPSALNYLDLAQTGRYVATAASQAELLYIRDKIALTASEQAERKVQTATA